MVINSFKITTLSLICLILFTFSPCLLQCKHNRKSHADLCLCYKIYGWCDCRGFVLLLTEILCAWVKIIVIKVKVTECGDKEDKGSLGVMAKTITEAMSTCIDVTVFHPWIDNSTSKQFRGTSDENKWGSCWFFHLDSYDLIQTFHYA